jgi:TRAP-type mannitol/chloroaromatic compound transport system permease small subunit
MTPIIRDIPDPGRRRFGRVDTFFARIAGVALLLMMAITVVSSLGRYLFAMPVPDMVVINEMLLVCVVFLPMAYAQLRNEHVEVTLFTGGMHPRRIKWLLAFGCLLGAIATAILAYALALGAIRAYQTSDLNFGVFRIYTWPARSVAALGTALLSARLILDLLIVLRRPAGDLTEPSN